MDGPTARAGIPEGPGPSRSPRVDRVLPGWGWAIIAACATALAILARGDFVAEVILAALAVAAAGLTVAFALGPRGPPEFEKPRFLPVPLMSAREALRSGELGREELVYLLDRLERVSVRPTLPIRKPEELAAIVGVPEDVFLGYLESRIRELEGAL